MTYPKLLYRPDIDGLLAFSVIAIILFHLKPNYLPSGFLITSIIYPKIKNSTFSFS